MFTVKSGWYINYGTLPAIHHTDLDKAVAMAFADYPEIETIWVLDGAGRRKQVIHRNLAAKKEDSDG